MQAGDSVGHYRILEPLGKGGMGEVFAAEDTRLHRRVALKVLPGILASDPDARQRFEREAQAVAALNHPGIVTIHSVEEHDGRLVLTMELVDGKPLGEIIPRGGVPLDRLLRIGIEVADALAAAQQRGITHRDVKPANIMVTGSGRAKVLDFGLAKVHEAEAAQASDDLTRIAGASDITGEGKIVGTVAYMSPEQAEGKPVDPRSDIFSLGVVLHEMATGEKPFKGDTNVSVISSILKDTPPPITDSNPNLPADLARIVRRSLAKDPDRRYQTAADLRNELEELKQDTASGTISMVRPAPPRSDNRRAMIAGAAALVLTFAIAGWLIFGRGRTGSAAPEATFTIDRLSRLTTTGSAFMAAISPDGRYVVHVKGETGGFGLWMRQTATTSDVRIVPPGEVRFDGLAFSPDGDYVFYSAYAGNAGVASLFRVPVLGGTPVRVLDDIDSAVTFSPDGRQIAFLRGSMARATTELMIAGADGNGARALAAPPAKDRFQNEAAAWSPDGTTLLVTATSTRPGSPVVVYAVDAASGQTRQLGDPWGFARDMTWLPDGRSFLITAVDLNGGTTPQVWRVTYPGAERSRVTNDLNAYINVSLSSDGKTLATVQTETNATIYVVEKGKEPLRLTSGAGREDGTAGMTWLPDGRLVFTSTGSGLPQLWIVDGNGQHLHQLTSLSAPATRPRSAPDGRYIYFQSAAPEGLAIFRVASDGSGLQQLTRDGDAREVIVSRDGQTLFYTAMKSGNPNLMKMPADGGTPSRVTDGFFRAHDLSPDGTTILGNAWNEPARRVMLATLTLSTGAITSYPESPTNAQMMPDGRITMVVRRNGRAHVMTRALNGDDPVEVGELGTENVFNGAVAKDGRVAISRGTSSSDVVLIRAK